MASTQTISKSSGVKRDGSNGTVYSIGIAQIKVVSTPEKVRTVLGSCIGVALYDRVARVGGLAHVILPDSSEGSGDPGKFADTAVDMLLEQVVAARGEQKRLVAKITGGASMFGGETTSGLGLRNSDAVRARLTHHAIRLAASDVGGTKGRRMLLDPETGDVEVQVIGETARVL